MGNNLIKNRFGFFEAAEKPNNAELAEYYSEKYYQDSKGSYEQTYPEEELQYFHNKIDERYWVVNKLLGGSKNKNSFLDIGSGEGFTLKYFKEKNWDITGIDFSEFGCKKFNPDCVPHLLVGDIYTKMTELIDASKTYDVIWLDNVLEHVLDPLYLLTECKKLLDQNGIIVIEVPNDFSVVQRYLLERKYINSEFWVAIPDHISYFSKEGLINLANEVGFRHELTISDNPVDFNLVNPDTNYNLDKTKGKNAHRARVEIDNLMHSISVEKAVNYFKALADLGMGRNLIGFFKKQ